MNINFIKEKDYVAIIAPSSSVLGASEKLEKAVTFLEKHKFKVKYNSNMLEGKAFGKLAASKTQRLKGLSEAIKDPEVKIIWAFRGGYGSTELINDLTEDTKLIIKDKILIGFSDITALHFLFNQKFKVPTIHGSVLTSIISHQAKMYPLINNILSGGKISAKLIAFNQQAKAKEEELAGILVGGNLTVLCNLLGTKLHPKLDDKILILEDVDEKSYAIHRALIHLHNSGVLGKVKAVIFGDFEKSDQGVIAALRDFSSRYLSDVPCYRMNGFGHAKTNYPLVFGCKVKINDVTLESSSPFKTM